MNYYQILLSGLNLSALTYQSDENIEPYTQVMVLLRGKKTLGYVLKKVEKPSFKTLEILQILPKKLTEIQIALLEFISYYYAT